MSIDNILFFDTETTGLPPKNFAEKIVENLTQTAVAIYEAKTKVRDAIYKDLLKDEEF